MKVKSFLFLVAIVVMASNAIAAPAKPCSNCVNPAAHKFSPFSFSLGMGIQTGGCPEPISTKHHHAVETDTEGVGFVGGRIGYTIPSARNFKLEGEASRTFEDNVKPLYRAGLWYTF